MFSIKVKYLFLLLIFSFSSLANSQKYWGELLSDYNMKAANHSFCYSDSAGEVKGSNTTMKVRLASVSKLITSLWAVEKLGGNYQYKTKFFLKGNKLHIQGDLDPVFSSRKLFFLLSQLNNLGVNKLEEITFDSQTKVYTRAERYIGEILNVTNARSAANLKDFWNTPTWNKLIPAYKTFIKGTPNSLLDELQIRKTVEELDLTIGKVYPSKKNPLKGEMDGYIHLSPEMFVYLKYMNIVSNNYFADQIFDKLGGEKEFDKYLNNILKENPELEDDLKGYARNEASMKMYSGSGLNTTRNGSRVDNFANCRLIVFLVKRLKNKLDDAQIQIQKVVAVPGVDLGTFRSRLRGTRMAKSVVAKTGTLYHTSALSGMIHKSEGDFYFGIFHQLTGWKGNAKIVQNKMLEYLWENLGEDSKFEYKSKFFFPAVEPLAVSE